MWVTNRPPLTATGNPGGTCSAIRRYVDGALQGVEGAVQLDRAHPLRDVLQLAPLHETLRGRSHPARSA